MTHQEIAAEIEALGVETAAKRKALDAEHCARMIPIREKCGAIGHIYILSMTFRVFDREEETEFSCAVCHARRPKEMKSAA